MSLEHNYFIHILNENIINSKFIDNQIKKIYLSLSYNHIIWILIHSFTVNFDENLLKNNIFNNNLYYLINNFHIFKFKCIKSCGNSYTNYLNNYFLSIDDIIRTKYNLIVFFMDYHNSVNQKINKIENNNNKYIYNYDEILKFYTDYNFIKYFNDEYNINICNLLLEDKINLIDIIDKIQNKIDNNKINLNISLKY